MIYVALSCHILDEIVSDLILPIPDSNNSKLNANKIPTTHNL